MRVSRGWRSAVVPALLAIAACGGDRSDGDPSKRSRDAAPVRSGPRVSSYDASKEVAKAGPVRSDQEERVLMDSESSKAIASMEKAGRPASLIADEKASHEAIGRVPASARLAVMTLVSCQEARARESAEASLSKRVARIDAALALGQGLEAAAASCRV